jgi:hypothetical protein
MDGDKYSAQVERLEVVETAGGDDPAVLADDVRSA